MSAQSFLRSWLFAPANNPRRVEKALRGEASAVILDLEDAVPENEKIDARDALKGLIESTDRANLFIRINALETHHALGDIEAIVRPGIRGVMLPKSEDAEHVRILDWVIGQMEWGSSLPAGAIEIIPLVETAIGFQNLASICRASPRVRRLTFGAADFTRDLGLTWTDDETELLPWRSMMVLASRAAGLEPPIDAPWIKFGDADAMVAAAQRSRALGFGGKLCIHPDQIAIVQTSFAPTADEIEDAAQIVAAFELAGGAAIQVRGRMIDAPVVESARRILRDSAIAPSALAPTL